MSEPGPAPDAGRDPDEVFRAHRGLLFAVAYEILGSADDAEDVVQESWLRWREVDPRRVGSPRAYLARIATRQALNRVRTLQRRRETYVGPWLPEPLPTDAITGGLQGGGGDAADRVALTDAVSFAMLIVLETLGPVERVVFVLREVFGFGYDEIAAALDRTPAAVRQTAHRARGHVRARRPRLAIDRAEHDAVLARFLGAAAGGDLTGLLDVLAPDVVLRTDSDGRVSAARRPVSGSDRVGRFLVGLAARAGQARIELADINGTTAVVVALDGRVVDTVMVLSVDAGRVAAVDVVRNPDKLTRVSLPARVGNASQSSTGRSL